MDSFEMILLAHSLTQRTASAAMRTENSTTGDILHVASRSLPAVVSGLQIVDVVLLEHRNEVCSDRVL